MYNGRNDSRRSYQSVKRNHKKIHTKSSVGRHRPSTKAKVRQGAMVWLIIYCFTSPSRIFHLYGDVTIANEGLQNLGLCSTLRAFEQGGIFIVPHLLWHGTSVFPVLSKGPPHSVASYDIQGDAKDLFQPGSEILSILCWSVAPTVWPWSKLCIQDYPSSKIVW
jgi:hypothetical protein